MRRLLDSAATKVVALLVALAAVVVICIQLFTGAPQKTAVGYLPVAILTSSSVESDLVRGYELRANSYIRKPVDFSRFIDAAREIGLYWLVLNEMPPRTPAK